MEMNEPIVSWKRILLPVMTFGAAWIYARMLLWDEFSGLALSVSLAVMALLLVGVTVMMNRKKAGEWESWIWLGCFALNCLSLILQCGKVWETGQVYFFVHVFFVWWVVSRSGKLLDGKSGHFLPLDALNAFIIVPFTHFFDGLRHFFGSFSRLFRRREKSGLPAWTVLVVVVGLGLFAMALRLLTEADSHFATSVQRIMDDFLMKLDWDALWALVFSVPVCAWLYGLISGSRSMEEEKLIQQKTGAEKLLSGMAKVPGWVWTAMISLFSLLYLAFFILQGTYLFGAFSRSLPEGFTVAQYAREGFFELCKVMAVNFALLWMVTRTVSPESRSKAFLVACIALLAESMVFAVIAFSKIMLYISCFGFTPLRLQSTWLVCVLFAGCALWLWNILTGHKAFRPWMIFGAVTLSILAML